MDIESIARLRVGQGYDVHQLVEGRPLMLGGIDVPANKGLLGHSDADALLHAITDAIFGAAALGDIGQHFSDRDPQYKGADSGVLLQTAVKKIKDRGFVLVNIDSTVICQQIRLASHIPAMRQKIALLTGLPLDRVNVKAKTNEELGYLGRGEAIEAQAAVLLFDQTPRQEHGGGE